jgi:hypothetical protein
MVRVHRISMRLLDLLVFLGARRSWARGVLAYRVLQTVVVAERAPVRR